MRYSGGTRGSLDLPHTTGGRWCVPAALEGCLGQRRGVERKDKVTWLRPLRGSQHDHAIRFAARHTPASPACRRRHELASPTCVMGPAASSRAASTALGTGAPAQWIEHRSTEPYVAGAIPSEGTSRTSRDTTGLRIRFAVDRAGRADGRHPEPLLLPTLKNACNDSGAYLGLTAGDDGGCRISLAIPDAYVYLRRASSTRASSRSSPCCCAFPPNSRGPCRASVWCCPQSGEPTTCVAASGSGGQGGGASSASASGEAAHPHRDGRLFFVSDRRAGA